MTDSWSGLTTRASDLVWSLKKGGGIVAAMVLPAMGDLVNPVYQ